MCANDSSIDVGLLKESIAELRRLHDAISVSYEGVRTKSLALLAGEVAMITFIFTTETRSGLQKPYIISMIVLYGLGLLLLLVSFILLLWVISPTQWDHPPESKDLRSDRIKLFNNSSQQFLTCLKDDYINSIALCSKKLSKKSRLFVIAILALSGGIFIITMLRFGSGTINY
jgi:hypothetical protein